MARFSMFAAYRAAVSDDMFDLAGTPGARSGAPRPGLDMAAPHALGELT